MKHVLICGAGFAAATAVKTLRKQGFNGRISLLAPKPELFYYPSLIWVPAGQRTESDLQVDLRPLFKRHKVDYIAGKVTGLDAESQKVLHDGGEIQYDALIIATGGRYLRKLPGIESAHIACAGWDDTKAFSDKLASLKSGTLAFGFAGNPKEPSAMRGGPVFEFLFGTDTLLRQQGRRDQFSLVFFSPAARPGQRLGDKAVDRLLGEMKKRGIDTRLGQKPKKIENNTLFLEQDQITADAILFVPGMTGPDWAADSGLSLSEGGFFKGQKNCLVEGCSNIFVAGDAGSFPGPDWKPKQAHMADLQAEAAAKNCIAIFNKQTPDHTFKTELICIIDTLSNGSLIYRGEKRSMMFKMPPLHWAKNWFEKIYLKAIR